MKRLIIALLTAAIGLSGCGVVPKLDEVLPDKRTEYKKSKSLPDLEVPPDLTSEAITDSMSIPDEGKATASAYSRGRNTQQQSASKPSPALPDEQWVSTRGASSEIWPDLREFFAQRDLAIEVDDAELGVLETAWTDPVPEGAAVQRYKYKVFAEPAADPDHTLLVISSQRQEGVPAGDGSYSWLDREGRGSDAEKQLAGDLNVFLNAGAPAPSSSGIAATGAARSATRAAAATDRKEARILNSDDGQMFLAIPEEFTLAWRATGTALQRAGITIDAMDPDKGLYQITYFDNVGSEDEGGWFSKLAFWKDDEARGRTYQISLTGVGNKTELIVVNEKGEWESGQDADRILSMIRNQYNVR